jgi:hypothetical protein
MDAPASYRQQTTERSRGSWLWASQDGLPPTDTLLVLFRFVILLDHIPHAPIRCHC